MKKLIIGGLSAALAALMFAASAMAEAVCSPGFARFTPCPKSHPGARLICTKEVVEIQGEVARRRHQILGGIEIHPPAQLEKQKVAGETNCYIGSSGGQKFISATAASASTESCTGADGSTQLENHFSNERKQLEIATSYRAVSG